MNNDQTLDKEFADWDCIYNMFEETYNSDYRYDDLDDDMLDNENSNEDNSLNEDSNNFTEDDRDTAVQSLPITSYFPQSKTSTKTKLKKNSKSKKKSRKSWV
ncbi:hypothetical protein F8M41_003790 [Gigaspora margarita]|uniref:Uncharacterized protein n=1 Tax=Gigaspora margarita TaxID=4874 RepID=A0A8H3XBG0_GIGMA|nr:hypothetical protein F8M41_003790 [Gigaspora margarita]